VLGDTVEMIEATPGGVRVARAGTCRTAQSFPALENRSRSFAARDRLRDDAADVFDLDVGSPSVVVAVDPPGVQLNIPMELAVCALPPILMSAKGMG